MKRAARAILIAVAIGAIIPPASYALAAAPIWAIWTAPVAVPAAAAAVEYYLEQRKRHPFADHKRKERQ